MNLLVVAAAAAAAVELCDGLEWYHDIFVYICVLAVVILEAMPTDSVAATVRLVHTATTAEIVANVTLCELVEACAVATERLVARRAASYVWVASPAPSVVWCFVVVVDWVLTFIVLAHLAQTIATETAVGVL
jgi:uncharacterized membrane protein YhaH (DUF805 family)